MRHSLSLYSNILLRRISNDGIPTLLTDTNLRDKLIKLIVVVKNAQKKWLLPISNKINTIFHNELLIWKIDIILVRNENDARLNNFII